MSIGNPSNASPVGEFQAHFGTPPGALDAVAECKKWEKLCGELLADRQRLTEELAKIREKCDAYQKNLYHLLCKDYKPDFDKEFAFAHLDDKPTIQELIADLEAGAGK